MAGLVGGGSVSHLAYPVPTSVERWSWLLHSVHTVKKKMTTTMKTTTITTTKKNNNCTFLHRRRERKNFFGGCYLYCTLLCDDMAICFYHGPNVSRATVLLPSIRGVTDSPLTEQTRTNMSQPGRRPGTAVGYEWHILQTLWNRKDI